jgi:hypothetical protein
MSEQAIRRLERLLDGVEGVSPDLSQLSDDEIRRRLDAIDPASLLAFTTRVPVPQVPTMYAHLSDDEVLSRLRALREQLRSEGSPLVGRRRPLVGPPEYVRREAEW